MAGGTSDIGIKIKLHSLTPIAPLMNWLMCQLKR